MSAMNPEQPAHGEVKPDCDICGQPYYRHMDIVGAGRMCPVSVVSYRPKRSSLPPAPPATDVALREAIGRVQKLADTREAGVQRDARHRGSNPDPAYHRSHATVASVSLIDLQTLLAALSAPTPPDQPQIGDVERVARAISKTVNSWDADGDQWEGYESEARAAIAAMPKGDIWEEAALVAEALNDWDYVRGVNGEFEPASPYDRGQQAAAKKIAASLRDRRAK